MPKYKFERNIKSGTIIDKISYGNSNIALDIARGWMKEDKDLISVKIEMINPKSTYKIIIERC
jgi:hypothetical protein